MDGGVGHTLTEYRKQELSQAGLKSQNIEFIETGFNSFVAFVL